MTYGFALEGDLNDFARRYQQAQVLAEFEREQATERWLRGEGPQPGSDPGIIRESGPLSQSRQTEFNRALRAEQIEQMKATNAARVSVSAAARTPSGSQGTPAPRGSRSRMAPVIETRMAQVRAMGGSVEECRAPGCTAITVSMNGPVDLYCLDHGGS